MNFFVTEEFLHEARLISKNKNHSNLEFNLIESIFNKSIDEIKNIGTKRLGGHPNNNPFLRKRIGQEKSGKSSGYRLYFWLFIQDKNVFLLFIHPKTGRRSASNISIEKQKELVRTFKEYRDEKKFVEIEIDKKSSHLIITESQERAFK